MSKAPHIDAFNRNIGRPVDEDPFEAWFGLMHRYANRKIDTDVRDVYLRRLGHIPVARLSAMWESYILEHDNVRDIPSIKRLLDIYRMQKTDHQVKHPEKPEEFMDRDPFKVMLFPAVHHAIIGSKPPGMKITPPEDWIQTIATYAGQQYREGLSIADAYALAIKMLGEERAEHE